MPYRVLVDLNYPSTTNADTAIVEINIVLAANGRAEAATRSGTTASVLITDIQTQTEAITLRNALTPAWSVVTRSGGKVSCVRTS